MLIIRYWSQFIDFIKLIFPNWINRHDRTCVHNKWRGTCTVKFSDWLIDTAFANKQKNTIQRISICELMRCVCTLDFTFYFFRSQLLLFKSISTLYHFTDYRNAIIAFFLHDTFHMQLGICLLYFTRKIASQWQTMMHLCLFVQLNLNISPRKMKNNTI